MAGWLGALGLDWSGLGWILVGSGALLVESRTVIDFGLIEF